MSDCLFCRMVTGEIPADVVHSTDRVLAFRDIHPQAPTHVLVVPRRHVPDVDTLADDDAGLLSALFAAVRRVAEHERLAKGYRVVTNVGAESGQSVFHLHFHVLGGRRMGWPPG